MNAEYLISYIQINTDDPQQFHLHVEWTFREECWIKFYAWLIISDSPF